MAAESPITKVTIAREPGHEAENVSVLPSLTAGVLDQMNQLRQAEMLNAQAQDYLSPVNPDNPDSPLRLYASLRAKKVSHHDAMMAEAQFFERFYNQHGEDVGDDDYTQHPYLAELRAKKKLKSKQEAEKAERKTKKYWAKRVALSALNLGYQVLKGSVFHNPTPTSYDGQPLSHRDLSLLNNRKASHRPRRS